ncbi:hypothetical protein EAG_00239, partial [Camponotus floridanus]
DTPSSASCYICGAKPTEMNQLERVKEKRDNTSHYEFVTDEQKRMKNEAKERICTEFREELGLLIDIPNQGTGNTNSGNTARRFFSDPDLASKITKVNAE